MPASGARSGVCVASVRSSVCVASVRSGVCMASVRSGVCVASVRSSVCVASVRSGVCVWSVLFLLVLGRAEAAPSRAVKEVYVAVGSSLSVGCDGGGEGVEVEWRMNGSVFQGAPAPRLTLLSTRPEHRGVYTCHGPEGNLLSALELRPGYPPPRPVVRCWSPSYPLRILCSWLEHTGTAVPTHHIATHSGNGEKHQCHPYQDPSPSLPSQQHPSPGSRWLCVLEGLDMYTSYQLHATAVNPYGRSSYQQHFTMEDLVKPDPPVNVRAVTRPGSRKCSVEWTPPPSWSNLSIFPLKYKVRYRWDMNATTNPPSVGPYESSSVVLGGLVPGRTYVVQVCAMDLMDLGHCSDWSTPVNITIPAR